MSILVSKLVRANRFAGAITMLCFLAIAAPVCAQSQESGGDNNSFWNISKSVLLDPTTYVPVGISYTATKLDWNTSQPFFRQGFVERNPRFTISGLGSDVPLSYDAGNKRIIADSLMVLQMSAINNLGTQVFERMLIAKNPEHRNLIRTIGWVERIAFSSYFSYRLSEQHWRQWRENEQLAGTMNIR